MSSFDHGRGEEHTYDKGVVAEYHCNRWDVDEGDRTATRPDDEVSTLEPVPR